MRRLIDPIIFKYNKWNLPDIASVQPDPSQNIGIIKQLFKRRLLELWEEVNEVNNKLLKYYNYVPK